MLTGFYRPRPKRPQAEGLAHAAFSSYQLFQAAWALAYSLFVERLIAGVSFSLASQFISLDIFDMISLQLGAKCNATIIYIYIGNAFH